MSPEASAARSASVVVGAAAEAAVLLRPVPAGVNAEEDAGADGRRNSTAASATLAAMEARRSGEVFTGKRRKAAAWQSRDEGGKRAIDNPSAAGWEICLTPEKFF